MEIRSAKYLISSPNYNLCPLPDKPEYAFIGRSNVGKSSLINMLTHNKSLAKVSKSPGKTQMINHFIINNDWYLVDLPGYGYAKRSLSQRVAWEKMLQDYLKERENLVVVFVLIDSRHEPQKKDMEFLKKLGEWQVPFCLAFTKADKSTQRVAHQNKKNFTEAMKKDWQFIPQSFLTSAEKYLGRKEMLQYIDEMNTAYWTEENE